MALNRTTKSENRDGPFQGTDKLIIAALKIYYLPLCSDCFGVGDGVDFDKGVFWAGDSAIDLS